MGHEGFYSRTVGLRPRLTQSTQSGKQCARLFRIFDRSPVKAGKIHRFLLSQAIPDKLSDRTVPIEQCRLQTPVRFLGNGLTIDVQGFEPHSHEVARKSHW